MNTRQNIRQRNLIHNTPYHLLYGLLAGTMIFFGCSNPTSSNNPEPNQAPVLEEFSYTPSPAYVDTDIAMLVEARDNEGDDYSILFDYDGDGNYVSDNTTQFDTVGEQTIDILLEDNHGLQNTYQKTVSVNPASDTTPPEEFSFEARGGLALKRGAIEVEYQHIEDPLVPGEQQSGISSLDLYVSPYSNLSREELDDSSFAYHVSSFTPLSSGQTEEKTIITPLSSSDWTYFGGNRRWTVYLCASDGAGNERYAKQTVVNGGWSEIGHIFSGTIAGYTDGTVYFSDKRGVQRHSTPVINGSFSTKISELPDGLELLLTAEGSSAETSIEYENGKIDNMITF